MTTDRTARLLRWRRTLRRHRRPIAAGLTFLAVLTGLSAVRADPVPAGPAAAAGSRWTHSDLPKGSFAAPVRITDAEVAQLLRPGDLIDVVAADGQGGAAVVAAAATVLSVPGSGESLLGTDGFGGALVVIAVPAATAVSLAGAAAVGPLSVVLRP